MQVSVNDVNEPPCCLSTSSSDVINSVVVAVDASSSGSQQIASLFVSDPDAADASGEFEFEVEEAVAGRVDHPDLFQ